MKRIALFARWPSAGRVKTRLSPSLPPALACDLYRATLADAIAAMSGAEAGERWIYWTGAPADAEPSGARVTVDMTGVGVRTQHGDDLGARLEHAFNELLASGDDRAVVIGGDCPDLGVAELDQAFTALEHHDLVLGPAADGGYYLIGLAGRAPELFKGIDWSTERVLEQTLGRAKAAGLTFATLAQLEDLDTPQALLRWLAERATRGGGGAEHTVAALIEMGLLGR